MTELYISKYRFLSSLSILFILLSFSYLKANGEDFSQKTVIAFGADFDQNKPQPLWDTLLRFNPDIFLFLGDTIYADTTDEKVMRAEYAKLANQEGYKKLLEQNIPIMATWDDHDFGADDANGAYPKKKQSQRIFLDFFNEPLDSLRRKREGIFDAKIFGEPGSEIQIIALDTRYFQNPNKLEPNALLGKEQWEWLDGELKKPAQVRIIMSSIQVITKDNGWENWGQFSEERARLFQLIRDTNANGVIFVSGDRHIGELTVMDAGIGYPLYDLTTGSFNSMPKIIKDERNPYRVSYRSGSENFGLITIDWGFLAPPHIILEIRDRYGHVIIKRKIPLALLQQGILPT